MPARTTLVGRARAAPLLALALATSGACATLQAAAGPTITTDHEVGGTVALRTGYGSSMSADRAVFVEGAFDAAYSRRGGALLGAAFGMSYVDYGAPVAYRLGAYLGGRAATLDDAIGGKVVGAALTLYPWASDPAVRDRPHRDELDLSGLWDSMLGDLASRDALGLQIAIEAAPSPETPERRTAQLTIALAVAVDDAAWKDR